MVSLTRVELVPAEEEEAVITTFSSYPGILFVNGCCLLTSEILMLKIRWKTWYQVGSTEDCCPLMSRNRVHFERIISQIGIVNPVNMDENVESSRRREGTATLSAVVLEQDADEKRDPSGCSLNNSYVSTSSETINLRIPEPLNVRNEHLLSISPCLCPLLARKSFLP